MGSIRDFLKIAPQPDGEGFRPSWLGLKLATSPRTDYDHKTYPDAHPKGKDKVLVVCTEQRYMTMENGKKFATGNHPVELFVPLLHMRAAGYDVEIATPTGKPVQIETWAMPYKDEAVRNIAADLEERLTNPESLARLGEHGLGQDSPYAAVFFPGGHGAMLGLPENPDLAKLVRWFMDTDRLVLAICHGPAALLSDTLNEGEFDFKGFKMVAFPDVLDKNLPKFGYLPGKMPWLFGERLRALGVSIENRTGMGVVHRDRNVITGDGPKAANSFGKLCAQTLLERARSAPSADVKERVS